MNQTFGPHPPERGGGVQKNETGRLPERLVNLDRVGIGDPYTCMMGLAEKLDASKRGLV